MTLVVMPAGTEKTQCGQLQRVQALKLPTRDVFSVSTIAIIALIILPGSGKKRAGGKVRETFPGSLTGTTMRIF